jgi:hypothetical protein
MYGSPEQVHLPTQGERTTLLQTHFLKCQDKFYWTEEAERALQDLKQHLQSPSILTAPLLGENLLLYIAATTHVISSAIVVERSEEGHAFGV